MTTSFDELDLKIIRFIEKDVESSYLELAKEAGVSVSTIYKRVQRLKSKGVIKKIVAQIDYEKLGFGVHALICVSLKPRSREGALRELMNLGYFHHLYELTGRYDYMIEVSVKNIAELREILVEKMSKIDGVLATETFLITNHIWA